MFKKKNNIIKKLKTKELKTKDGYNRFKFMGKIFRYKEDEIHEIEHDFSGMSVPKGMTYVFDEYGNKYIVEFLFNKKWLPFSITPIGKSHW